MSEGKGTIITFLSEGMPYHVNAGRDNYSVNLSAQALLDIAAYVEANRARLEDEARADAERGLRTPLGEAEEMRPIKQEWRYRTSDLLL